jgi:hypothetical protein
VPLARGQASNPALAPDGSSVLVGARRQILLARKLSRRARAPVGEMDQAAKCLFITVRGATNSNPVWSARRLEGTAFPRRIAPDHAFIGLYDRQVRAPMTYMDPNDRLRVTNPMWLDRKRTCCSLSPALVVSAIRSSQSQPAWRRSHRICRRGPAVRAAGGGSGGERGGGGARVRGWRANRAPRARKPRRRQQVAGSRYGSTLPGPDDTRPSRRAYVVLAFWRGDSREQHRQAEYLAPPPGRRSPSPRLPNFPAVRAITSSSTAREPREGGGGTRGALRQAPRQAGNAADVGRARPGNTDEWDR